MRANDAKIERNTDAKCSTKESLRPIHARARGNVKEMKFHFRLLREAVGRN